MSSIINSPLFGITISLLAYTIGVYIYIHSRGPIFNPILLSILFIILFLLVFDIDYSKYELGGDYISFFLGPATVILAVPLYKKISLLKQNLIPILVGITAGCIAGITSVILFSHLLGLNIDMIRSLVSKSVTTPIGVEITKSLNGIPSISIIAIVFTGIIGTIIAPFILKICKINDPLSKGIAIGTSSHALGTTKAMEIGETEGAMSGLSIGIAGLVTLFLAPFLLKIFTYILKI